MSLSNPTPGSYPGEEMHVLLVEDNPGDVRLTQEAFEESDAEADLHVVTDGEEALDFLTQEDAYESAPVPDLILLDLDLPRRPGTEVLEIIRDDPELRVIPVIILTVSESSDDVAQCYETGANAFLTKPSNADEFTRLVKGLEQFWFSAVNLPPV